jgi:glutathione S-transferase
VQDGEYTISQSTACAMYIAKKAGLTAGQDDAKAVQHLADIVDFSEGGVSKAAASGASLKEYIEGDRIKKVLANIERSIKGPFYCGDSPTCADFFLTAHTDWMEATLLDRLKQECGADIFAGCPKMQAVVAGIRGLASYSGYAGPLPTCRPDFKAKDSIFEAIASAAPKDGAPAVAPAPAPTSAQEVVSPAAKAPSTPRRAKGGRKCQIQ